MLLRQGETVDITSEHLSVKASGISADSLEYVLSSVVEGEVLVGENRQSQVTFTQKDIDDGSVTFIHSGAPWSAGIPGFTFTVHDGATALAVGQKFQFETVSDAAPEDSLEWEEWETTVLNAGGLNAGGLNAGAQSAGPASSPGDGSLNAIAFDGANPVPPTSSDEVWEDWDVTVSDVLNQAPGDADGQDAGTGDQETGHTQHFAVDVTLDLDSLPEGADVQEWLKEVVAEAVYGEGGHTDSVTVNAGPDGQAPPPARRLLFQDSPVTDADEELVPSQPKDQRLRVHAQVTMDSLEEAQAAAQRLDNCLTSVCFTNLLNEFKKRAAHLSLQQLLELPSVTGRATVSTLPGGRPRAPDAQTARQPLDVSRIPWYGYALAAAVVCLLALCVGRILLGAYRMLRPAAPDGPEADRARGQPTAKHTATDASAWVAFRKSQATKATAADDAQSSAILAAVEQPPAPPSGGEQSLGTPQGRRRRNRFGGEKKSAAGARRPKTPKAPAPQT